MGKPFESFEELVESEVRAARARLGPDRPLAEAEEITVQEIPKELVDLVKPLGKIDTAWFGVHGYILDVSAGGRGQAKLDADDLKRLVASKHFRWISPAGDGTGWNLGLEHDKPAGEWAKK